MKALYKLKLRLLLVILLGLSSISAQSQTCTGIPAVLKTFGAGVPTYSTLTPSNYGFSSTYKQENGNNSGIPGAGIQTNDGEFSFINKTIDFWGVWHGNQLDHTPGDVGGYMMMVNASNAPGEFYRDTVSGLCSGIKYDFSAWVANMDKNAGRIKPDIKFEIIDFTTNNILGTYETGDVQISATFTWIQHSLAFTATSSKVILRLVNNNPGGSGNDLALDDISFTPCLPVYTTTHPTVFCEGENVKIPAFTTATNPYVNPVYQWQIKSGSNWVDIAGENTDTLRFNNLTIAKKGWYRVLVASAGNINSPFCRSVDSLYLDVVNLPTSVLLGGEDICKGNSANLKITFTVNAPWDIVYTDGTNNVSINGINTNPYVFSVSPTVSSTYSVNAVISNSCKAVSLTGSAVVNVNSVNAYVAPQKATCTGNIVNNDASIFMSPQKNPDTEILKYDYSFGNTYTGSKTYTNATLVGLNLSILNLPNPLVPTDYTVRFMSIQGCISDNVVTITPTQCFCNSNQSQISTFPQDTDFSTGLNSVGGFDT